MKEQEQLLKERIALNIEAIKSYLDQLEYYNKDKDYLIWLKTKLGTISETLSKIVDIISYHSWDIGK